MREKHRQKEIYVDNYKLVYSATIEKRKILD